MDAAEFEDWTGDFGPPFPRGPTSVSKHLSFWRDDDALTYKLTKTAVTLRGVLDEDTYRDACAEMATAFRAIARHGGRGELVFFGIGEDISCVVAIEDGTSTFRDVPEQPAWRARSTRCSPSPRVASRTRRSVKPMQKEKDANAAAASALAARTDAALAAVRLEDAALDALFQAIEPTGSFYNPYEEPTKSALARLEPIWADLSVLTALHAGNLVSLLVQHRCREARPLLLKIHETDSARFDLRVVAARALLGSRPTPRSRRSTEPRETMVARWNRPNVEFDRRALRRLAKA